MKLIRRYSIQLLFIMPVAALSFGSFGDIIALAQLIGTIILALKEDGDVSHDIQTFLNCLQGFLNLLRQISVQLYGRRLDSEVVQQELRPIVNMDPETLSTITYALHEIGRLTLFSIRIVREVSRDTFGTLKS